MKFFTIIKDHSTRVKDKNFRLLGHKPLWTWYIDELGTEEVFINTDSQRLIEAVGKLGRDNIHVLQRSDRHIEWESKAESIGSPVVDMTLDFCKHYCAVDESVCLFHVTSPFVKLSTIKAAEKILLEGDFSSVHSVSKKQDVCFKVIDGQTIFVNASPDKVARTQDLEPLFFSNGAFFIFKAGSILKTGSRLPFPIKLLTLNAIEGIEIDNVDDFHLAELVAKGIKA